MHHLCLPLDVITLSRLQLHLAEPWALELLEDICQFSKFLFGGAGFSIGVADDLTTSFCLLNFLLDTFPAQTVWGC